MTAVFTLAANFSLNSDNSLREYHVEVITYDGESVPLYIEARSESEAQSKAAAMVDDADYIMVHGCMA